MKYEQTLINVNNNSRKEIGGIGVCALCTRVCLCVMWSLSEQNTELCVFVCVGGRCWDQCPRLKDALRYIYHNAFTGLTRDLCCFVCNPIVWWLHSTQLVFRGIDFVLIPRFLVDFFVYKRDACVFVKLRERVFDPMTSKCCFKSQKSNETLWKIVVLMCVIRLDLFSYAELC